MPALPIELLHLLVRQRSLSGAALRMISLIQRAGCARLYSACYRDTQLIVPSLEHYR